MTIGPFWAAIHRFLREAHDIRSEPPRSFWERQPARLRSPSFQGTCWEDPAYVAPSDKITLAYIGVGTQGLREMLPLLPVPEIQIVSVCDPNKDAAGYRDWSSNGILTSIRRTLGKPDWWAGADGVIPGGRDAAQDIVDTYYAGQRSADNFKGCSAYADFRELLEKEKDLNAVKIMTPDHLHGVIAIAAMKRGKHVIVHKPIANRLKEGRTGDRHGPRQGRGHALHAVGRQRVDGAGDGLDQ